MAGSDIFAVSANSAVLHANASSNAAETVTLFAGPTRLKGFIVEPSAVTGTLSWKDNGVVKFQTTTGNVDAGSSTVQLNLPAEGIKFKTNLQVTTTIAGANVSTTKSLTAFHA
tara:strand:+ start:251 stop:589 length:339 start_codon:yes stop_codon:yes gene_type:complete